MKILFIPHVIWKNNDDRICLNELFEKYKSSNRITIIEDCNCEEIKGYISNCRFFIGARTHATIAAYSSIVPTLVLGYSVKSVGIARDLFGSEDNFVVSAQTLSNDDDLVNRFKWIMSNEISIKNRLSTIIPEYKNRVLKGVDAVRKL